MSALLGLVGSFWIGRSFLVDGKVRFGNPVGVNVQGGSFDPQPRQVRAEVTRVVGQSGLRPGDMCEFLVERRLREKESFYCNAQVVCGGRLLFGGPQRGFFSCRLEEGEHREVIGSDASTTDGDPGFSINTALGVMRIWDDGQGGGTPYEVEAEVLSVH
ncbi:MAG: hypothetical protein ABW252_13750 [Polyangiales bacterium]